ncbi:MAG: transposase [Labilithrix sp.]|nr:transposase [Labilithrix sp.]
MVSSKPVSTSTVAFPTTTRTHAASALRRGGSSPGRTTRASAVIPDLGAATGFANVLAFVASTTGSRLIQYRSAVAATPCALANCAADSPLFCHSPTNSAHSSCVSAIALTMTPKPPPENPAVQAGDTLVRRLDRDARGREVRICYEAGTCGYTLQRRLEASGKVVCEVIAPSLIPVKPGERIKTDKRDARKLAELYRAGVLTTVSPPSPEQEAIRDLCRCREDVRADLGRCRHRLVKMLVRRGFVFNSTSRLWSEAHRRWLKAVVFDNEIDRTVMAGIHARDRPNRSVGSARWMTRLRRQPSFRFIASTSRGCVASRNRHHDRHDLVAEMHGLERLSRLARWRPTWGSFPACTPAESPQRGGITKTGNGHIRRAHPSGLAVPSSRGHRTCCVRANRPAGTRRDDRRSHSAGSPVAISASPRAARCRPQGRCRDRRASSSASLWAALRG